MTRPEGSHAGRKLAQGLASAALAKIGDAA
jgi:hypothetical protein